MSAHAEALQPCRQSSAQVVQPPARNTGCGVGWVFAFDHPLKDVPRSPEKTSDRFARRGTSLLLRRLNEIDGDSWTCCHKRHEGYLRLLKYRP